MEQLRATLKSDLQEKNDILDKLTHERGKNEFISKHSFQLVNKIKTEAINLVNHNRGGPSNKPIRTRRKYMTIHHL